MDTAPDADYGPAGYLPPRASQRARKIVLRGRMGLGWPLAALAAALVIALAGGLFALQWRSPPREPWVRAGVLAAVPAGGAGVLDVGALTHGALLVRAAGDVRAFAAPAEAVSYCPASGRLESPTGAVWTLDGRALHGSAAGPDQPGGASLTRLPAQVFDGTVYLDPTQGRAPAARPVGARPACLGAAKDKIPPASDSAQP